MRTNRPLGAGPIHCVDGNRPKTLRTKRPRFGNLGWNLYRDMQGSWLVSAGQSVSARKKNHVTNVLGWVSAGLVSARQVSAGLVSQKNHVTNVLGQC
jgi:hypothetical protein